MPEPLLRALDHPELSVRGALIAGTNGKGSVLALVDSALRAAGYHVGTTPKPHLVTYRERIQIDGALISEEEWTAVFALVHGAAEELLARDEIEAHPSFFETLTAMAFVAFARAGVDVDLGNLVKRRIQARVKSTHGPEVLGKIGGFGGLFAPNFSGMREPVLVASVDGVGSKLKIAFGMNKHDTVGMDLVNHCVDDIAVLGARPLFFLDYIGCERLEPRVFQELLRGLSRACRAADCALLGGETAQMPGMYRKGEYDLAGCIVGVVDRIKIINGSKIKPGDVVLGLASNGLHTNGY